MGFVLSDDKQYLINFTESKSQLYIHKNLENFDSSAATVYFQQKANNANAMFSRYKQRFIQSVNLTKEAKETLEKASPSEQDKFIQDINKGIEAGLSTALSESDISSILAYANTARDSYKNGIQDIQSLDTLLGCIAQATEIVSGKGNALASLLLGATNNLAELPKSLQTFLNEREGTIVQTSNKALDSIAKSLLSLIEKLQTEGVSAKSLSSYVTHIFSTCIGEGAIAVGVGRAMGKGINESIDTFLSGTKSVSNNVTIVQEDGIDLYQELSNSTYKPDIIAENFSITTVDNGDSFDITLGLSAKTYKNISTPGGGVSIVTGKPFEQILLSLFADGKYYVSNTLAHLNNVNDTYRAMKKSILLTYADNFLGGTGGGTDFAQYVIINGRPYAIYDILKEVIQEGVLSGATSFDKNSNDPIVLSIQGAGEAQTIQNEYPVNRPSWAKAWERSQRVNELVSGLKVHAYLKPSLLSKSI